MALIVRQVGDEPIIIISAKGRLDHQNVDTVYEQVNAIAAKFERGPIFRIADARGTSVVFRELRKITERIRAGERGSSGDPRFRNIFVGKTSSAMLVRDLLRSPTHGAHDIPIFDDLDAAIAHAREQLAKHSAA